VGDKEKSVRIGLALIGALHALPVYANVDLDLRPDNQIATVGSTVNMTLYAVSDNGLPQSIGAMDVIITWDPTKLQLLGFTNTGNGYTWLDSGFMLPGGLNTSTSDGDAIWTAFAQFGSPAYATASGLWVTRFQFQALTTTAATAVAIPATLSGQQTAVYDGVLPNTNVTGALDAGANVAIFVPNYPVTSFTVAPGIILSGTLADVQTADNNYIVARPGVVLTTLQAPLIATATATLPSTLPTSLSIDIETAGSQGGLTQRIEVFNYDSGLYELADFGALSTTDTNINISITTNAPDYVDSGTGQVKVRMSYRQSGPVLVYPWTVRFDHIEWTEQT
jgi:hypothetical protein